MQLWTRPSVRIAAAWTPVAALAAAPVPDRAYHGALAVSVTLSLLIGGRMYLKRELAALEERLTSRILELEKVYGRVLGAFFQSLKELRATTSDTGPFPRVGGPN